MGHGGHIIQDDRSEFRYLDRKEISPVHRRARFNKRVILVELCSKVNSLLEVGLSGSEFASHREVAAPGSAAKRHPYFELCLEVLSEESSTQVLEPNLKVFIHAMINDVEEPVGAARFMKLCG